MIKRGRGQEVDFLFGEIQFDLSEISKLIGCSVDDVFMLIHFIFNRMRTSQVTEKYTCSLKLDHQITKVVN